MSEGVKKALIVGVSEYEDSNMQKLDFCKNDGEKMYEILNSVGYKVLNNASMTGHVKFENMRNAIYDFFNDPNNKFDDTLVFYYSGHGIPDSDGDVYLSTSDINPDEPYRAGFSFNELTKRVNASISTRIVLILDCCYSGAAKISKGISKGSEEAVTNLATAAISQKSANIQNDKGICLLAASQATQEAYALKEGENSLFTHYLLEGLKGKREALDVKGKVTAESLGKYIHRSIVSLPQDKRPKQIPIRKVEVGDEIVLAEYPEQAIIEVLKTPSSPIYSKFFFITSKDSDSETLHSDNVFTKIIKPISNLCDSEPIYENNKSVSFDFANKLINSISDDEFIIVDLTFNDPIVVYITGLCHALRKHVIKIRDISNNQHRVDLPGMRPIEYDFKDNNKIETCKNEIFKQISLIRSRALPYALNLPPRVEMIVGAQEVLGFLNTHKKESKEEYCTMWVTDEYDHKSLLDYYLEESKMKIGCMTRLINTKTINRSLIKEHVKIFKDDINSGKYAIFPTKHDSYEIIYCKKDKSNSVAGLLFPDNINNKVDLAIYSTDPIFVEYIKIRYRDLQRDGKRLRITEDLDKSVEDWIEQTSVQ